MSDQLDIVPFKWNRCINDTLDFIGRTDLFKKVSKSNPKAVTLSISRVWLFKDNLNFENYLSDSSFLLKLRQ